MNITAVVLCSGTGKRMGRNKLLLPVEGKRMFEYVLDTIKKIGFSSVIVVTPYGEIRDYAEDNNCIAVYNPDNEEGIAASVRIGAGLAENSDGIMFFNSDQPFIDGKTIRCLIDDFNSKDKITVPVVGKNNKNPVIFPIRYRKELLNIEGDIGGRQISNEHKTDISYVIFESDEPFLDIDTMEDLKKVEFLSKKC